MNSRPLRLVAAALCVVLVAGPAVAAIDPGVRCQISRLKLASRYASCRLTTDAKALVAGTQPDYTACDGKLELKWAAVEARYGSECPPTNAVSEVEQVLTECTADALVPPASYFVVLRATNAVNLSSLVVSVDYSGASGEFAGSGPMVSCSLLLGGAIFAPNDNDGPQSLELGFVSLTPATTPSDLARCRFDRGVLGLPDAGDFEVTVDSATDGGGNPIAVTVEIASIEPAP